MPIAQGKKLVMDGQPQTTLETSIEIQTTPIVLALFADQCSVGKLQCELETLSLSTLNIVFVFISSVFCLDWSYRESSGLSPSFQLM